MMIIMIIILIIVMIIILIIIMIIILIIIMMMIIMQVEGIDLPQCNKAAEAARFLVHHIVGRLTTRFHAFCTQLIQSAT